jgi:hypothetical protein
MTLDDLNQFGIVTAYIEDSELGRRYIACVGQRTAAGIRSSDGQYWTGDTELEAARRCYDESGFGEVPDSAKDAPAKLG